MLASALLLALAGVALAQAQEEPLGRVQVDFTFHRLTKIASNQVAVWIEDAQGRCVATVYASRFTAAGGYRRRPGALADWVRASGWATAAKAEVDAVTRPTPKSGPVTVTWNCTDRARRPVPAGVYTYRLEGSIFWKNRVVWTGTVRVGPAPGNVGTAPGNVGTAPDASAAQPAWIPADAAKAGDLVGEVRARFIPG